MNDDALDELPWKMSSLMSGVSAGSIVVNANVAEKREEDTTQGGPVGRVCDRRRRLRAIISDAARHLAALHDIVATTFTAAHGTHCRGASCRRRCGCR
jgi:hypothetical protein